MNKTIKPKRVIRTGDAINPEADIKAQTDRILSEIAQLYRDRFRALYNKDLSALQKINQEIDLLKAKLSGL